MKCAVCGSEYHTNFCPNCGSAQPQSTVCAGCGLAHGHDFCPQCGTAGNALACRTADGLQEVRPAPALAVPGQLPAQHSPAYPPAGTYPPPPLPQTVAEPAGMAAQAAVLPLGGGMPSITVNTTSLTGDANTIVTLAPGWPGAMAPGAQKNKLVAFLLCFFFGIWGVHRFYTGKIGTGVLWLLSGGMFGIGWLVDVVSIVAGAYKDANGYPLKI